MLEPILKVAVPSKSKAYPRGHSGRASASGVNAIEGSTVVSTTEQWRGGVAYPPSQDTDQVPPTSSGGGGGG